MLTAQKPLAFCCCCKHLYFIKGPYKISGQTRHLVLCSMTFQQARFFSLYKILNVKFYIYPL